MESFLELLKYQFKKNSNNPAVIYHNEVLTFCQLEKEAKKISALLQGQGLEKGDRVALYTSEKFPFLVIHLGIILSGGVSLPLNFDSTQEELVYFLNDSSARFIFASNKEASRVEKIKNKCLKLEKVFKHGESVGLLDTGQKFKEVNINAGDPCFIFYSSGTTGLPKGVVHTHQNVSKSLLALQKFWKFTPEDVVLNVLPLHHLHGLGFATHLGLISGSSVILEDNFLYALDKLKDATVFMGIPPIYYALLKMREFKKNAKQWNKIRLFTCGSAPVRPEVLSEFRAVTGKILINRYGMTEGHVLTSIPLDGPFKEGSVGIPLDGIEMKLNSEERRNGQRTGEIVIKSENLFSHYWNNPELTRMVFDKEGFFLTGDIGHLDKDGFLTLLGRKDDLIITNGENVYPLVIEKTLDEFNGVQESAVIGIPDNKKGEKIVAVIVPNGVLDIQELKKFCQEKLVNYQQPGHFELVKELPRNTMGKVLKRILKERYSV